MHFDPTSLLAVAPQSPGVYQMYDCQDNLLYVGKARNLKKRLSSYFRAHTPSAKTRLLVSKLNRVDYTLTHSEGEALLLESTLIKQHKPRYNVLLRDDKSYPFLFIGTHADYPRLDFHRGAQRESGRYFGPYPSTHAVRESLQLLQKLFRLRQCRDSFFNNRQRPCLQYQINRCSAPCVGYISVDDYRQDVRLAELFLSGKSQAVIEMLITRMQTAAAAKAYEQAAQYRDQIANLRRLQDSQHVAGKTGDADVIALMMQHDSACIAVVTVRNGSVLGSNCFYPTVPAGETAVSVLTAFLAQYYLNKQQARQLPSNIIINQPIDDAAYLTTALTELGNKKVHLAWRVRGERAHWLALAITNANQAVARFSADKHTIAQQLIQLTESLSLTAPPQRIECFDISHTQGAQTVAACVVFDHQGARKSDYRRFNITGITAGDDYAAMHQALQRRYTKVQQRGGVLPDLLIIDGGKGQLTQAKTVLEELQVTGITLLGIAKGVSRKPGLETLYLCDTTTDVVTIDSHDGALHLLQQIRDEAHRFAITGHRQRRARQAQQSILDDIPGIGSQRRRQLLQQFGGLQGLKQASVEDIATVPGISRRLADAIFARLHKS